MEFDVDQYIEDRYPNPAENQVSISVDYEDYSNLSLLIISPEGKLVRDLKLNSNETLVDLSNCTKGVYLYQLKRSNAIVEIGKFIIN